MDVVSRSQRDDPLYHQHLQGGGSRWILRVSDFILSLFYSVTFRLRSLSRVLCVCSGLMPHMLGELLFLWGCNLLSHLINTYAVDESVSPTPFADTNTTRTDTDVNHLSICVPAAVQSSLRSEKLH